MYKLYLYFAEQSESNGYLLYVCVYKIRKGAINTENSFERHVYLYTYAQRIHQINNNNT